MSNLTLDQIKELTDPLTSEEVFTYLKQQLFIAEHETLNVIGELSARHNSKTGNNHFRIYNVKFKNGKHIEYPIYNLEERETIRHNGIYVPYDFNKVIKDYVEKGNIAIVTCSLILSSEEERGIQGNPYLLSVDRKTILLLNEIEETDLIKNENGNILIEEILVDYYVRNNTEKIRRAIHDLEEKHTTAKKEFQISLEENKKLLDDEIYILNEQRNKTENERVSYEKIITQIKEKNKEIQSIDIELINIQKRIEINKEIQMKNLERFRTFIKNKSDTLLSMEFISQKQYDILMGNYSNNQDDKDIYIDFKTDLGGNFSKAISHIQVYLYEQGNIYPKYILEDYFSLLQTNDLIILAGDSGSGKTNLVISFAEAVGGISKIIPVKPNWTSSEDLLGYYNPLEKKYLTTPFLETLLEAERNPSIPYFICLDEMNLARVEYYFADFLSWLEERKNKPEIFLYSDTESGHILSEFNNVINSIESSKEKFKKGNLVKYIDILKDEDVNNELKRIFGFSDKDSLIKYHSDLRKMISGILDVPSSIAFPENVRIIGAINIDETTHYLSPKVLDRAHVMKFESPLLYDRELIASERYSETDAKAKIKFSLEDFNERKPYPTFDWEDEFCAKMADLTKEYFVDLGVDVGFRTIRQGLNYRNKLSHFQSRTDIFFNNFILHKILPKFTFDGNSGVKDGGKISILKDFKEELRTLIGEELTRGDARSAVEEMEKIIEKSIENDGIINYWA